LQLGRIGEDRYGSARAIPVTSSGRQKYLTYLPELVECCGCAEAVMGWLRCRCHAGSSRPWYCTGSMRWLKIVVLVNTYLVVGTSGCD